LAYVRFRTACVITLATFVGMTWPSAAAAQLVMGSGPGTSGVVRVIDPATGTDRSFAPYPGFIGGLRVALGDVNADGVLDIVTAPGPGGGPHVLVFDGVSLGVLASFYAYHPSFGGGVFVAAADVNGDGRADIVTGAGAGGGPHVQVFSGANLALLHSFYAYSPFFGGGVSVAAGDVNGDGKADIVTGAGPGGGPHVVAYSGADLSVLASFFAFEPSFPGGVNVAAGDVNNDGRADFITGHGPGGLPRVRVFSGATLGELASYFAYEPPFPGGVVVSAGDFNQDGTVDVMTGPGWGGGPHIKVFSGASTTELASFMAFGAGGGAFVGANAERGLRFTSAASTTFTAGTPGTFTVTTIGQPAATLTVDGTLPSGVTFTNNGDGTATLGGTPAAGSGDVYPLTFTANNGTGSLVTQDFTLTVNEAPTFTSAATTGFTTGAAQSFTVTTTGFPTATLSQGGALPAGVTWVDHSNGTGTLSGTPPAGSGGTFALTFTASNGVGTPVVQAFTLTVSGAPTFTSPAAATFTAGAPGSFTVTTVGTPNASLSVSGTLPSGVTFIDGGTGTGTLSGTPAAGTGGTYALTFTATNSVGSATQSFTLTVQHAPAITSGNATTFTVGVPGTFTVTTTGLPAPSLAVSGTLPAGVTFVDHGNGTGTLSGMPTPGTGGVHALTFTATNSIGASAPQAFTLTVNQGPAVTSVNTTVFTAGVAGSFTFTVTGFPLPTIAHTGGGLLPSGVTFVDHLNGTGTLSGTPAAGTAGAHTLTFTIANGVGAPVVHSFTLNVHDGPVITSAASATFAIGAVTAFTVTASGFPAPSLVPSGVALPSGVTFVDHGNGTGTLSGTPAAGTGGSYALTFTASNGSGSAVQTFTLTVAGSPGFTSAATTTFTVGAAGTFTVTAIGAPTPTLTLAGALPSGVTFVDNGNGTGTLSGTPAAGTGGPYALTVTAANGVPPDGTQAFTLTVNQTPAITSAASTTFTVAAAGTFTVTTSGFPAPTVAIGGVALPAGVTFVDNGDGTGTLSGTPAAGTGGSYAITFTASNVTGTSAPQAFTLSVSGPPAITSATTTTFTAGSAGSFTVTATGTPTPALTVSGTLPSGVTFVDHGTGTGTLSGTPAAGTGGTYPLTFTATNSVGSATQSFTLTVHQSPAISSAAATTFTVGLPGTFTVTTTGVPAPSLAIGGVSLPAGVTFVDSGNGTGTLSGTPAAGTAGSYAITFTATNSVGASAPQVFTLTVTSAPAFTSAAATTFALGVAGQSFTVTTVGTPTATLSVDALPAGVTFVDNLNGTGTLSGTPAAGTAGPHTLTFTATNGVVGPVTQTFTLTITEGPVITSAATATFAIGAANTFTVTASGFPFPTLAQGGAALPAGVTWVENGDGTGTLSGTPAAGTGGSYALTFTATNPSGSAVQNFTLVVAGSPAFTSAATTTFTVGAAGTFTVTAIGAPTPALTLSGALPSGVTFLDNGNGTGTLSGTPAAGTGGVHALTFTAANGVLPDGTQAFTLNVNETPAITSAAAATFTIGTPGTFTVTTSGLPLPAIAVGGVALPAGLTFVDNLNGTGTLSGTPAVGSGGTYALTFTATNTIGVSAPQAFTLTVNGPPSITSANTTTFTAGAAGTFTVTAIGTPAPTMAVSGSLPSGVTFLDNGNGTGTLSGTPGATTGGSYALTVTASNGVLPNGTQAFTLIVNQTPAVTSAAATTFTVGTLGSFTVTTSGFPLPTLARGGVALPAGVTFTDNGNGTGTLTGTPAAGTGGTYAITFTATNTVAASAPQAFTLTVNQAPAITSANTTAFVVGTLGSFTVTTSGFPAPTIARTGAALPAGVTFVDNGNGTATLSGTPAAGSAGAHAFTFTATNSTPPSATQAFTLNVNQPPAITSAAMATFTVGTAASFTVMTTGFPAPTVSQTGTLPTGVTFTAGTRVLGGTATQTGAFPLVFTATNAVPPDATQTFTLNVVCPAITVNPATMPEGLYQTAYAGVTFTQTGSTGSTFTWSATGLPAGLAIGPTTGVVSGTPTNTVANGAVVITATDNFGCVGTRNTTITVRPTTDNENYTGGVGNTQYVVGAAVPATPHVLNADLANTNVKMGDNGPGTLSVTFPATSPNGVITEGAVDGTFIYTPNVGFAGLSDTFTYTLTDGNGVTNTGTVTINLSNVVWYVNSAGANGDGRSHNPFNALNNATTPSLTNQMIYVHTGGATTPGNIALDANQTLHGQGATFSLPGTGLMILGGTRPTLSGTVTLANNTAVTAVNFAPSGIPAMTASAVTGPIAIDQVNITGGTNALSLTNVTGAVTVTNANFTNTSAAELLISGGTGAVTINSNVVISSNAGRSIDIQSRTGGIVTFSGPITDTGQGIFLNANTGSTINFTGGLALSTTTNPAFTATGGGTVSATQNNTTIINTITTTTGTAVNVANTTIGSSGLTFRSISANGGANGIMLNATGSGPFSVVGVGTTAGSGGTIQNTTTRGASFIGVSNITLRNMNFTNAATADFPAAPTGLSLGSNTADNAAIHLQNASTVVLDTLSINGSAEQGINGHNVNGFTLTNSTLANLGNGPDEDGLHFYNMVGTSAITNTTITSSGDDNVNIQNNNNLPGDLPQTTTGSITVTGGSANTGVLGSGYLFGIRGTMNTTVTITGVTSNNNFSGGIVIDTFDTATSTIEITNSASTNNNDAISLSSHNGNTKFDIHDNLSFAGTDFVRIGILKSAFSTTGTLQGFIRNNPIVVADGQTADGILIFAAGGGTTTVNVANNDFDYRGTQRAIAIQGGQDGSGQLNVNVTGNTIDLQIDGTGNPTTGIFAQVAVASPSGDNLNMCANIGGAGTLANIFTHSLGGTIAAGDIRIRQRFVTTVSLPGYAGSNSDNAAVVAYLAGRNTLVNSPTATATNEVGVTAGAGGFVGGSCAQPVYP
jgi:hypothetical protein